MFILLSLSLSLFLFLRVSVKKRQVEKRAIPNQLISELESVYAIIENLLFAVDLVKCNRIVSRKLEFLSVIRDYCEKFANQKFSRVDGNLK